MKYEQIIERCIGLRVAFERDEARFFLGLCEVENRWMGVLAQNGCETFDQFIRSHELCRVERYRAFAEGLTHISTAEAEQMGAPAVIAMCRLHEKKNAPAFVEAVMAWSEQHRGLTPRTETAERLLRQVDPRREIPAAVKSATEMEKLRMENAELRRKLHEVEREVARLKVENERLKKKPGKRGPTATAPG